MSLRDDFTFKPEDHHPPTCAGWKPETFGDMVFYPRRCDCGAKHMEIDLQGKRLVFNTKTCSNSCSASNLFVKDPNTEVYAGGLHVAVLFRELMIEIVMNPPGEEGYEPWRDAAYARERAWAALLANLTVEHMHAVLEAVRDAGRRQGANELRGALKHLLQIK